MTNTTKMLTPKYAIPATFKSEDDFLRHLVCKGAERRYRKITKDILKRIDVELETIKQRDFAGYFLLVREIIQAAHEMDIVVGPGRASLGCSIVNYCLGITEIDPLRFNLLFERFLTPEQTTPPHFDFDVEEEGREKLLRWLIEKYGKDNVAQMATFAPNEKLKINPCAVVIGTDILEKSIPVAKIKPWYSDDEMLFTSCERSCIEEKGLAVINLLPLRALSVIKKTLSNIKKTKEITVDLSKINSVYAPNSWLGAMKASQLEKMDAKTFELFRAGDTDDVFQFDSKEKQTYLHWLQPDKFEDLVALWVLFHQDDTEGISTFINRKRNGDEISYEFLDSYASKSHAIAYTLIGYQMAYLKANFRDEFEMK